MKIAIQFYDILKMKHQAWRKGCNRMSLLANANDEKIDTDGILGFNTDIAQTHYIG